ncbi:MAG: hypothetical protein M3137_00970 [Actinomycetota bacterium]|nr:hypothetical protein [Actinomycetota bacterium]
MPCSTTRSRPAQSRVSAGSIAMLTPGQAATIDRERALRSLGELQRLQHEHWEIVAHLRAMLGQIETPR